MKKLMCVLLVLFICFSTAACGSIGYDPVGEYADLGLNIFSVVGDFTLSLEEPRISVTIENNGEGLSFYDYRYTGSAEVVEDNLALYVEAVREGQVGVHKELEEGQLDKYPALRNINYFIYEDYLIQQNSGAKVVSGDLPVSGFADFSVEPVTVEGYYYCIDFFDDGSCEVEGEYACSYVFAEGKYEINGQIINITLENMSRDSDEGDTLNYTKVQEYALFIKDGVIYNGVCKKI